MIQDIESRLKERIRDQVQRGEDLNQFIFDPETLYDMSSLIYAKIILEKEDPINTLAGDERSSSLLTAIILESYRYSPGSPFKTIYFFNKHVTYGTAELNGDNKAILITHLLTDGIKELETIKRVKEEKFHPIKVITTINTEEGAEKKLKKQGVNSIESIFTLSDIMEG